MRQRDIDFERLEFCANVHRVIESEGLAAGTKLVLQKYRKKGSPARARIELTDENCEKLLRKFVRTILLMDQFEAAAALLWGDDVFDPTPQSCQDVFRCLWSYSLNMVMGAGSMGKSYSGGGWFFLDFYRDPEWTSLKVLSSTMKHAKTNIFAHMQHLARSACFDLGLKVQAESIRASEDERHGISLETIPQGDEGKGRLRGFHPIPRTGPAHPNFGKMSRVYVLLDEAEAIPGGVWEDIDNLMLSESSDNPGHVKLFAASNPKDRMSKFGQRCEPKGGWDSITIDESREWDGKLGWHVLRLDGALCENVVQREVVYPGMQTYEGFMRYAANGGDTTAAYYTMARGWFPIQGLAMNAIPEDVVRGAVGRFRFIGPVRHCVSFDLAFEGGDNVIATVGRFGLADGWWDKDGKFWFFRDRSRWEDAEEDGGKVPVGSETSLGLSHRAIQLEQQIVFPKERSLELAKSIIRFCKNLHIPADLIIVDRTGNGTGTYHNIQSLYGMNAVGLHYGEAASDSPIFEDEPELASELYDGLVSELVFCLGRYMEFQYLKLSPTFSHDQLISECSQRRFRQVGRLVRVEPKKEYMKRTQQGSPDHMDSASMLVHLVRMKGEVAPAMLPGAMRPEASDRELMRHSVVDALEQIDFSQD